MDKIILYAKESYNELLHKVTWPTLEELQSSTVAVIIASLIFSLAIFFMDFVFGANPGNNFFQGILYFIYEMFG